MSTATNVDDSEDVCHAVLQVVADCHGIDVLDIDEPLQCTIDGDSLSRLWGPKTRSSDVDGELEFDYYGCRVRVTSDGDVGAELE